MASFLTGSESRSLARALKRLHGTLQRFETIRRCGRWPLPVFGGHVPQRALGNSARGAV